MKMMECEKENLVLRGRLGGLHLRGKRYGEETLGTLQVGMEVGG